MSATLAPAVAGKGAGRPNETVKETVATPFEELFEGVDDLIRRVADVENPEIRRIRARVHASMVAARGVAARGVASNGVASNGVAAKDAVEDGVSQERRRAVQAANDADDYLRDYPGPALGVALLVGLGLGLIVSLRQ
jgi:ElaB/YqjD/DUF883 family membrane-anchored ribosome-binding protein